MRGSAGAIATKNDLIDQCVRAQIPTHANRECLAALQEVGSGDHGNFRKDLENPLSTAILWRLPCRQIRSGDFIARVREREQYLFPKPCRDFVLRNLLAVTVGFRPSGRASL